ncbi:hypothetical protein GmHk_09G025463 [Glycine max]|nr:hypothetical protein GmHk_09G025463 [Glycine max]
MHSITYNQDLMSPTLLEIYMDSLDRVFSSSPSSQAALNQKFTLNDTPSTIKFLTHTLLKSYRDVSNIMYSFMKTAGFIHLNLEGITKCRIIYNHWRKTAKMGICL